MRRWLITMGGGDYDTVEQMMTAVFFRNLR